MSQPTFAPVIYRTIPAGATTFGTIADLTVGVHEIWTGRRWTGITSITDDAAVVVNQYTTNAGTAFIGTSDQRVLARLSKTTIATGIATDVGYLPSEITADPVAVSYSKGTGVLIGTYVLGTMDTKIIEVDDTDGVYYSGGFIVDGGT